MNFGDPQTDTGTEPIVVECYFAAPPAKVFRAWTDPDIVMKWFGHAPNTLQAATIDLRPGGAWRFLTQKDDSKSVGFEGEYLDVQQDERLVFTWSRVITHANGDREAMLHAEIDITFTAKGSGTDIRLVHTLTRSGDSRQGIGDNWQRALNALAAYFTRRESGS